jgi:hypothetical protein
MADGTAPNECHEILLVALGNANDQLKIDPASAPAGFDTLDLPAKTPPGASVLMMWDGSAWQLMDSGSHGDQKPSWAA